MSYFVPINKKGETLGVWHFDGIKAVKIGVPGPLEHTNSLVVVNDDEDLLAAISGKLPGGPFTLKEMRLGPGQYYPRIARPGDQWPDQSPGHCPQTNRYYRELATSRGQLVSLVRRLESICQVVEPNDTTLGAFGHEIRNLLILASTEVEAQWRAVLKANGVCKENYTTNDYVKLNTAMKLNEYRVSLPHYPDLIGIAPFENWNSEEPTQTLCWYYAYNKVKHDRHGNFQHASLKHAIEAVCAVFTMLCAQFGKQEASSSRTELTYFFEFDETPKWSPAEAYIHPYNGFGEGYVPVNFSFDT